jgi:hypothetical protein
MPKRHKVSKYKVKNVYSFTNHEGGTMSFTVVTNHGATWFGCKIQDNLAAEPESLKKLLQSIRKHFPHLFNQVVGKKYIDIDFLKKFLPGKYIYGFSTEREINGKIYRTIIQP